MHGHCSLVLPRPAATWGPSCSEQGGVWEGVRGRKGGQKKMGAALGLSAAIGELEVGSSPRE